MFSVYFLHFLTFWPNDFLQFRRIPIGVLPLLHLPRQRFQTQRCENVHLFPNPEQGWKTLQNFLTGLTNPYHVQLFKVYAQISEQGLNLNRRNRSGTTADLIICFGTGFLLNPIIVIVGMKILCVETEKALPLIIVLRQIGGKMRLHVLLYILQYFILHLVIRFLNGNLSFGKLEM